MAKETVRKAAKSESAIAPDDRVYTWYEDGTYSIGTSANLTAHQEPRPFQTGGGAAKVFLFQDTYQLSQRSVIAEVSYRKG
ncbi:MAG: hypothetical protein AAF716_18930 [Cyanobacteria bacterium P01_D01_bin.1]